MCGLVKGLGKPPPNFRRHMGKLWNLTVLNYSREQYATYLLALPITLTNAGGPPSAFQGGNHGCHRIDTAISERSLR